MRCFQKCSAALVLAVSLLLHSIAFAEEGFTFDGFGPTGTVQELWNTLKSKGYDCDKDSRFNEVVLLEYSILPSEITTYNGKYKKYGPQSTLTRDYLKAVKTDTADLGGVKITIITHEGGGATPEINTSKVCGVEVSGTTTLGKDILATFTKRYGKSKLISEDYVWVGETQRACLKFYGSRATLHIQNIAEFNVAVRKTFTDLDNKLAEQEKMDKALEEQKKSRI